MPDLGGMPVLDVAIGLAFIFLLLSLLATTIQEAIAARLGLRARTLEQGLRNMLKGTDESPHVTVRKFYKHPLIDTLYQGEEQPPDPLSTTARRRDKARAALRKTPGPSYISPRAFATFVLDQVAPADGQQTLLDRLEDEASDLPEPLRKRLLPLANAAGDDVDAFRMGIEHWYDDTMARVSGWYKRRTQRIVLVIAVVVVVGLNVNTLRIGDRLWSDQAVRAAVVQAANAAENKATGLDDAAAAVAAVEQLRVPIGWSGSAKPQLGGVVPVLTTVVGWTLTIIAISLGAPFWFDTLGRLSRLRSSGKPETPLPATSSGRPNERVTTPTAAVNVQLERSPAERQGP